jgi:hypothetical protein
VQGAAGPGHQGRHAEFGEHVRGRLHLRRAAHRVPAGAVRDPVQGGGVGCGQFGRDVLAFALLTLSTRCAPRTASASLAVSRTGSAAGTAGS